MKNILIFLCAALAVIWGSAGVNGDTEAESILKATGIKGGLCLVVGADDTTLSESMIKESTLYVQQLVPKTKTALLLSNKISKAEFREKISIRNAAFNPNEYGSNLFNLIIVKNWAGDTKKAAGIVRIMTPNGVLAVNKVLTNIDKLGLEKLKNVETRFLYKKIPLPPEIKPTDSVKWRAGARWKRMAYGDFTSIRFNGGKMVYREKMSVAGGGKRFVLFCRDAYNGRRLWKIEEPPFTGDDWKKYLRQRMGLAVAGSGDVFTGLGKDFVRLNGETGKVASVIAKDGRPAGGIFIHQNKYLLAGGSIYDLKTKKVLAKYPNGRIALGSDAIYTSNGRGNAFSAYTLPDCKEIWKVTPKDQPPGQFFGMFCSDTGLHIRRGWPAASLSTMDLKTGKTLWTYPPPPRPKVRDVLAYPLRDKLYIAYKEDSIKEPRDFTFKEVEAATGKVIRDKIFGKGKKWSGGCWGPRRAGDYLVYHHNYWLNLKTGERTTNLLYRPKRTQGPLPANGLLYAFPGRKGGAVKGIAALTPAEFEFDNSPGGSILKSFGKQPEKKISIQESDWPMYRANPQRANSLPVSLGKDLKMKWEAVLSVPGKTYSIMDSERIGLAQATSGWGMVFTADIEGQRVVALDAETGSLKWIFHTGSRIEFSPTLYNGLCLFGDESGWVWCVDAHTGKAVYKLLIGPKERLIGGQEKLESMWPQGGDILIADGIAYTSAGFAGDIHGGIRAMAFKPESGEILWKKVILVPPTKNDHEYTPGIFVFDKKSNLVKMSGRGFDAKTGKDTRAHGSRGVLSGISEDWLSTNNLDRLSEDMGTSGPSNGRGGIQGRLIAFSNLFETGFSVAREGKTVFHIGVITLKGKSVDGKIKWAHPTERLNIDDLLVTKDMLYCVGHFEQTKKSPELRIISQADGSIQATITVNGFPAYNGMSASGNKLFIATREGKLICFEGK